MNLRMSLGEQLESVSEISLHRRAEKFQVDDNYVLVPLTSYELANVLGMFKRLEGQEEHNNGDWFGEVPWILQNALALWRLRQRLSRGHLYSVTNNYGDEFDEKGMVEE